MKNFIPKNLLNFLISDISIHKVYIDEPFRAHDTYSLQSEGNNFCGDVVLVSFNEIFLNEDHILYQTNKSKCVKIIIMMILILYTMIQNAY